jgi:hypothetical protein
MENTNWIEKIKEAVRVALNKGFHITTGTGKGFPYTILINHKFGIYTYKKSISISTPNGYVYIDHSLTDREELEIQALILSIKEYNEDMAISEFEEFISDKKEEITNINDLDNDEE